MSEPRRLCGHCGERIVTIVRCTVCGADLSDLAYHSGPTYAIEDHAARVCDDAHLALLED